MEILKSSRRNGVEPELVHLRDAKSAAACDLLIRAKRLRHPVCTRTGGRPSARNEDSRSSAGLIGLSEPERTSAQPERSTRLDVESFGRN